MSSAWWGSVADQLLVRSLLLRHRTLVLGLLLVAPLIISSVSTLYVSYVERRTALLDIQREKATAAAARIVQYLVDIEQRIALTAVKGAGEAVLAKRMTEVELLSHTPAITQVMLLDKHGKERLKVSSLTPDAIGRDIDDSAEEIFRNVKPGRPFRSAVRFVRNIEPYLSIAMAVGPEDAGVTVAEVNLDFMLDGIRQLNLGPSGYAYVVDSEGRLIAHTDLGQVLAQQDLKHLPQVAAAMRRSKSEGTVPVESVDLSRRSVFSAYASIPHLGWLVFVEQPRVEALALLDAKVVRTGLLLLAGCFSAALASLLLIRPRQTADAASKQKSAFLAMMSQEMRAPLGGVIGMLGLVLRDPGLLSEVRKKVQLARTNAQSLLVIINDVLDVSKIEAGSLTLETVDFDLQALIQEAVSAVEIRAHDKDLVVLTDLPSDLPRYCQGDPARIRQVLLNLLGNAVKFTDRGGVSLTVRRGGASAAGAMFEISVIDTGPGIAPEAIPRLFEKFEQAGLSPNHHFGGVGLGLVICWKLTELMGGRIVVSSEVGRGSTFCVHLPLKEGQSPPLERGAAEGSRHTHRLRILCAEDGPTHQIIIRSILEDMGHQVEIAEDGLAALKLLSEREFDLVLMDGRMPRMNGEEAARCIRAGGLADLKVLSPSVSVIALTADAGREDRDRYLAAGMDGFLSKPIDEQALCEEIRRVISALLRSGRQLPLIGVAGDAPGSTTGVAEPATPVSLRQGVAGTPTFEAQEHLLGVVSEPGSTLPLSGRSTQAAASRPSVNSSHSLMARIAAAFVEDAPLRLRAAQEAVNRGDAGAVALELHSLRGAAGYAKLTVLQEALAELEGLADTGDLVSVAQGMKRIEPLLQAGLAFLSQVSGPRLDAAP